MSASTSRKALVRHNLLDVGSTYKKNNGEPYCGCFAARGQGFFIRFGPFVHGSLKMAS